MVWNDVPAKNLPQGAVIECWNSSRIVQQDARLGHDVIVAKDPNLYFNHCQGDPKYERYAIGPIGTLRDTYHFNPSSLLPPSCASDCSGAEACLWTEEVPTAHHLFYQMLPREMALAEICWTPLKNQHYSDFVKRTARQYLWLRANNYNFRIPPPSFDFTGSGGTSTATRDPNHNALNIHTTAPAGSLRISDPMPGTKIYYTRNGLIPDAHSTVYKSAILVSLKSRKPVVIRSIAIDPSGRSSAPSRLVLSTQLQK